MKNVNNKKKQIESTNQRDNLLNFFLLYSLLLFTFQQTTKRINKLTQQQQKEQMAKEAKERKQKRMNKHMVKRNKVRTK